MKTDLKIGAAVTGELFDEGTVIAVGSAVVLATRKYDVSGALFDALREGMVIPSEPCVAVKTNTGVAVYVENEVWQLT